MICNSYFGGSYKDNGFIITVMKFSRTVNFKVKLAYKEHLFNKTLCYLISYFYVH